MARERKDPMLTVLHEIRDEARQTNARLDQTNALLEQTIERVDANTARIAENSALIAENGARIDKNGARIDETGARIDRLAEQMVRGFTGMHECLDRLDRRFEHFLTGAHDEEHRWLQRRVERIENHPRAEPLEH